MTRPLSVVVVSRHRPALLARCVTAIGQLDHPRLELVVVADPAGLAAAGAAAGDPPFKAVEFDRANISAARNLGLDLAAGEVVAFIDDDAVPEPTWASRLAAPFDDPRVAAAGGFVRGRNGISYQWRAMEVDRLGADHPFEAGPGTALHSGTADRAVKTQGTNCAFRRSALAAIGGFDESLEFFLDEADVNLRLAAAGHLTAVVPGAQVHHSFAESPRRRADRTPLTLTQVGASAMVFLRRHAPEPEWPAALASLRQGQAGRLARLVRSRRMGRAEAAMLLETLEAGIAEGARRTLAPLAPRTAPPPDFRPLPGTGPRPGRVITGRAWSRARLAAEAASRAGSEIVTVIRLDPNARPHRMTYRPEGYWEQSGGLFGRSDRTGPPFVACTFRQRICRECERIRDFRPIGANPNGQPA